MWGRQLQIEPLLAVHASFAAFTFVLQWATSMFQVLGSGCQVACIMLAAAYIRGVYYYIVLNTEPTCIWLYGADMAPAASTLLQCTCCVSCLWLGRLADTDSLSGVCCGSNSSAGFWHTGVKAGQILGWMHLCSMPAEAFRTCVHIILAWFV